MDWLNSKENEEQDAKNLVALAEIEKMYNEKAFAQIKDFIYYDGGAYDFRILDEVPKGLTKQKEDYSFMPESYLRQECVFGDTYHGTVAFKLPDDRYFVFSFSC